MKERTLLKQLQRKNEKALEEIMKKYGAYVTVSDFMSCHQIAHIS